MKKIISLIMTGMMILTLTACTDSTKSDNFMAALTSVWQSK